MGLDVEIRDLGAGYVEGFFSGGFDPSYLALNTDLVPATIQARLIEGFGYYRKPPRDGYKVMLLQGSLDWVDEDAIRAMRPVVDELVSEHDRECVKSAYRASEYGDAYWIAWDCDLHPHTVMAILRNFAERGELF